MKPKRILIIADMLVWPPLSGNKARVWTLMQNLRMLGHEVTFFGLGLGEESADQVAAQWGAPIKNIPRIKPGSEKPWYHALKRGILDRLYVRGIGSPGVDHWLWPRWEKGIAEFSAKHQFDVVIAEYVFLSKTLLHFGPDVLKIIDTHDIWTGRRETLKALNIRRFWRYLAKSSEEVRGLKRADVIMSIQENESISFRRLLAGSRPVVTVGHTVEPQPLPLPVNSDILFIGSPYGPNIDGLMHFLEVCLPSIRAKAPDVRLVIAGTICEVLKQDLPGVKFLGRMEEVEDAYRSSAIVINPVRAGTGLKIKTIEALAFGRALITTPCGADGLETGDGHAFIVARDDSQFASAVVELLTNRAKLEALANGGLNFVRRWNEMQIEALQSILALSDGQTGEKSPSTE